MITLNQISVKKSKITILNDITLNIPKNSLYMILGPNGAGKTTLLKTICHLESICDGNILIQEKMISSYSKIDLARIVSWIPIETDIPFDYTALDLTILGRYPWHLGQPTKHDFTRSMDSLEQLDLLHLKNKSIQLMSSGEKRKVMLARAITSDARIILLDEPLSNLDPAATIQTLEILLDLTKQGKTIVASTHDLSNAYSTASHVALIKGGKINHSGLAERILIPKTIKDIFSIDSELIKRDGRPTSLLLN
jgi:iron complex transport system ATP-binding protein